MQFVSTRGGASGVSFFKALRAGCAPDGGLYVPKALPNLSREDWKGLAKLNYEELSKRFFRFFVSEEEIPDTEYNGTVIQCNVV